MSNDPWKNRARGMQCRTCIWFVAKKKNNDPLNQNVEGGMHSGIGRCRRHAPAMHGYPVAYGEDWCGDHKLDEDKI